MKSATAKQQEFSRQVALGSSLSHAYRKAYSASNMRPNTVHKEAHKLMQNPKVTTMVEALSSRDEVIATLTECMQKGEPRDSVRLKAAETLGKHYGLFTDRLAIEKPPRTAEEVREVLEMRLGSYLS
jgi:hypothetical protein